MINRVLKVLCLMLFCIGFLSRAFAQCGVAINTFPYNEDFETVPAWTSGGTNSDWAWGTPTHPTINTAGGGTKCWSTGSLAGSSYNASQLSWLQSPCFDFTTLNYPYISFKIFWEVEYQKDGMVFQSSLDGGITWANVGAFGNAVNCMNDHWYDNNNIISLTTAAPKHGWTGRSGATVGPCLGGSGSNGWVTAKHCLSTLANQPSVMFRFLFGSDTICNNYDGIAVDDILIDNAPANAANFTFVCGSTHSVNFTNTSPNCPNVTWNFGDPGSGALNTSTLQNPPHIFSTFGSFNVTLTTTGPCNAPSSVTIPVNVMSVNTSVTDETCQGSNDGAIVASVSGGAPPYTYAWSNGPTTLNDTGLAPGVYTLIVTCPNYCPANNTITLTPQPPLAITTTADTICPGQTSNITAFGADTYTWSAGATSTGVNTADASPMTTTTYTVTGTLGSCVNTALAIVDVNSYTVNVNSPSICAGQTANLTATGATTYSWTAGVTSTGVNTATAAPLTTTTYTVNGFSGNCLVSIPFTVTVGNVGTIIVNSPTICAGQTANLGASGATSYTWSAGATSVGVDSAHATPLTTSTYTVTGTSGTCSGIGVSTVTVNQLPTVTVNSPTICAGQTADLGANGATSYTWSAGANAVGIDSAHATPLVNTTYTVTGTTGLCSNTAIATVTVNQLPNVTVNSPTICDGQTANLTANNATTYTWSAGATSTGNNTANASPINTATYTVTGTTGICSNTAVSTVTVNPVPTVTVNSPTICAGQGAALTAGGATTYTWSAGAISTGNNTANAAPLNTTTYTVTGTSLGCSNTAVSTVSVTQLPIVTVNSPSVCIGQTTSLIAGGALNYIWSAGVTSTGINTADVSPLVTSTYTVTGVTGNCSNTAISTVTVNPLPTVTVNSPTICTGQIASLMAGGATTYTWSAGATPTGATTSNATPLFTTSYTVTGTLLGCINTAVSTVTVATSITITATGDSICPGDTAHLSANGALNYIWSNGATSSGTNTATATPLINTTYTIIGTNGSCADTTTADVCLKPAPVASFTAPPTTNEFLPIVNFTDNSTDATQWNWNFGDVRNASTNTSTLQNPSHTYSSVGTYCVILTVRNATCKDTAMDCIEITPEFTFYVPNSFTPDGDGVNDTFFGTGQFIKTYEMNIFDRWGQLIFYSDNIKNHWDGTVRGGDAVEDVYVYLFNVTDFQNNEHTYKGTVTVIR